MNIQTKPDRPFEYIDSGDITPGPRADMKADLERGKVLQAFTNNGGDFLTLHEKKKFNWTERRVKEERETEFRDGHLKFQCLPTKNTYYTQPDERYNTADNCPPYAPRVKSDAKMGAGCCAIPNNWGGVEFLGYLSQSVFRVSDRDSSKNIFSPDLLEWYDRANAQRSGGDLRIRPDVPYVNILIHFLFIAKPLFNVVVNDEDDYQEENPGRVLYDHNKESWLLTADDTKLLEMARNPGVNGTLSYNPMGTSTTQAPRVHKLVCMRSSRFVFLGNVGEGYVDVTNIADLFASKDCGFRGKNDIVVHGKGVISKDRSFYDIVLGVIKAMPDFSCTFQMDLDLGEIALGWETNTDNKYSRVHPIIETLIGHRMEPPVYANDRNSTTQNMYSRLRTDLSTGHRVPYVFATGGVVGSYTQTLYPDNDKAGPGDNYSLEFETGYRGYNGNQMADPFFRIKKRMLKDVPWSWKLFEGTRKMLQMNNPSDT